MSAVAHADLAGLVQGELANDEVATAGEHLHGCDACRKNLLQTVLGHALLARSARTLGPDQPERTPPSRPTDLEPAPATRRRPRRGFRLLVAAAALTATAGVGALVESRLDTNGDPVKQAHRSASLEAVGGPGGSSAGGTVSMTEAAGPTRMTISTHDLPALRDGQFYYAWLLDPATSKMLPLGQLGPSGTASFEVSERLLGGYAAVDVSIQDDDGDPQHSPTSVLRGRYA